MKKLIYCFLIVACSILFMPFSFSVVSANSQIDCNTIYPENILEYADLTGIHSFDINDNYIAYSCNTSSIDIFEKETKKHYYFNNFNNVTKIKFVNNQLLIVDSDNIKVIKDINSSDITTINEIDLSDIITTDIYIVNENVYVATLSNHIFKLYKYNLDLTSTSNNPIKTISPSTINFDTAFTMAINEKNAYIVYKTSNTEKYTTGLCTISLNGNSIQVMDSFQANARIIDTFFYNDQEFLLTFTNEILYLLSPDNQKLANINISTLGNLETQTFPIFEITDFEFYQNQIFVSDSKYKTIQSVELDVSDSNYTLKSNKILLASNSFDYGRFDGVSNIYIQGDSYFVSDTNNNRIQILSENKPILVDVSSRYTSPHSIKLDSKQNMFFVATEGTQNKIIKYIKNDNYLYNTSYYKLNTKNIGYIADICITNSDTLFALDSDNNCIMYISNNSLVELKNDTLSSLILDKDSQINYLKKYNYLVVNTNNKIYLIDATNGNLLDSITIENLLECTTDLHTIYGITNNKIINILINNDRLVISNSMDINFDNFIHYTFDQIHRKMVAFDKSRSCLTYFDCELNTLPITLQEINGNQSLDSNSTLIPLNLNNALIYEYPYELGNVCNLDNTIKNALAIEEYNDYYRILYNANNTLSSGYIRKVYSEKVDYTYNPINVITTNQIVSIYKYPTLLKYNNERIVVGTLPIGKSITLSYTYPISLDDKTFYLYQNGDSIGFIFNADVVLQEDKTIKNLNTENATIKLIGKENTPLLDEDKQTRIRTLTDGDRVYVESYDKEQKYTKVIIKDLNLNTYVGYVLTEDIKMDKLDNSHVALIIVIVCAVVLLILIITFYIIIKKKNK